jgi:hypothetical protein
VKKPLLLGEAPSRTSDPARPFDGHSGRRLQKLMPEGVALADVFELRNLLDEWPGASDKGSAFDFALARERCVEIINAWERFRLVVLVGRRVARAFGDGGLDYLEVVGIAFPRVVFPHPSGVDRWWNEQANVERARRFMHDVALHVLGG